MDVKTVIFIFCAIDIVLGFWCLFLSIQNMKLERYKNDKED